MLFATSKSLEPGHVDDLLHRPPPVDEREDLHVGVAHAARRQLFGIADHGLEDDVETRDLLLDQGPLVGPARAFEQQIVHLDLQLRGEDGRRALFRKTKSPSRQAMTL